MSQNNPRNSSIHPKNQESYASASRPAAAQGLLKLDATGRQERKEAKDAASILVGIKKSNGGRSFRRNRRTNRRNRKSRRR